MKIALLFIPVIFQAAGFSWNEKPFRQGHYCSCMNDISIIFDGQLNIEPSHSKPLFNKTV